MNIDKTTIDVVTSFFEIACIAIGCTNIFKLYKDKVIQGIAWQSYIFYVAWSAWEFLVIYPSMGLFYAWIAVGLRLAYQLVWLGMAIYYLKK